MRRRNRRRRRRRRCRRRHPDLFGALASRFEEQLSQTSGAEAEERGNTQPDPYDAHAAAEAARPTAKRPAPLFGLDCDVKRARGGENAGVNPFKVNPFGLP